MSRGIPWDSLKCEFRAYVGLLSLFKGDWTNCWCPEDYLLGWLPKKVTSRTAPVSLVARFGRVLERSRFRSLACSERAWEHAFQQPGLANTCAEILSVDACRLWSICAGRGYFQSRGSCRALSSAVCLRKTLESAHTFPSRHFGSGFVVVQGKNAVFSCACRHSSHTWNRIPCKLLLGFSMFCKRNPCRRLLRTLHHPALLSVRRLVIT